MHYLHQIIYSGNVSIQLCQLPAHSYIYVFLYLCFLSGYFLKRSRLPSSHTLYNDIACLPVSVCVPFQCSKALD